LLLVDVSAPWTDPHHHLFCSVPEQSVIFALILLVCNLAYPPGLNNLSNTKAYLLHYNSYNSYYRSLIMCEAHSVPQKTL